jgi:nucleotide-binding universal stress UspA family protein
MTTHSPCVVVGYDGSPTARAAVELAVERVPDDGSVIVVNAYELPSDWYGWPAYSELLRVPQDRGSELLDRVAVDVPALDRVAYETELIGGRPAASLESVAEARHAREIIVGSRGFGPARALLGSVAHELLHIARRPVTVVPARSIPADAVDGAAHHENLAAAGA